MNVQSIRAWLMIAPRPKAVRVSSEGVAPQTIATPDGTKWIQVAESIAALQPELVEALTAEGGTIRAMRPDELDAEEESAAEDTIPVNVNDPLSVQLITISRLLADAYRHSTDVAFDKLLAMFDASTRRQESLERSVDTMNRMLNKAIADQLQASIDGAANAGGGTVFEQLISSFMQARAQGEAAKQAATAPPNGANGAAKPEAS
jgi:hypothetical protein